MRLAAAQTPRLVMALRQDQAACPHLIVQGYPTGDTSQSASTSMQPETSWTRTVADRLPVRVCDRE